MFITNMNIEIIEGQINIESEVKDSRVFENLGTMDCSLGL